MKLFFLNDHSPNKNFPIDHRELKALLDFDKLRYTRLELEDKIRLVKSKFRESLQPRLSKGDGVYLYILQQEVTMIYLLIAHSRGNIHIKKYNHTDMFGTMSLDITSLDQQAYLIRQRARQRGGWSKYMIQMRPMRPKSVFKKVQTAVASFFGLS